MNDYVHENPIRDALAIACRERGIASAEVFRERFGIAPASLTSQAALTLVTTPAWVIEIWLPNAGSTPVVWVPAAVRVHAGGYGIHQQEGESDHAFTLRLQATLREKRAA
jgi:hypothetical protein